MYKVSETTASPNNKARVAKLNTLQQKSGLRSTEIARGAGISYHTYLDYIHGKFHVPTSGIIKLSKFHKVPLPFLLSGEATLPEERDALDTKQYSIENAVTNLRVLSLMKGESYNKVAHNMGANSRMIERIGIGMLIQRADIYVELAEYFGLTIEEFLRDCTVWPSVHDFFERQSKRQRVVFLARVNGEHISREQVSKTGRQSTVGIKDLHWNRDVAIQFAQQYHVPLGWILDPELDLEPGTTLRTRAVTVQGVPQ